MHPGPDGVGAQPQQQFEDFAIGFRSDAPGFGRFERLPAPRLQRPVLVVEEDAAVGDRGTLQCAEIGADGELRAAFGGHIAPPHPRRDTRHARKFEDAVGCAAAIAADDSKLFVVDVDVESVGFRGQFIDGHACFFQRIPDGRRGFVQFNDADRGFRSWCGNRFEAGDLPEVAPEQVERHTDDRCGVAGCGVGDGV